MHTRERPGETSVASPHGVSLGPIRHILLDAAVLLLVFVSALSLQRASGAHFSAMGAEPDEAAHYVTGVMVRDYIARGLPGSPVEFATDFYLHYPRVAFGLWPPLFHFLSGAWMLAFGTGRLSVMFLLAALTATWAFVFYRIGRPVLGTGGAAISALLLVFLPTTQLSTSAVMLDIPLAIMMLLAMSAYARYLARERTADAIMFGLYAAVALLVKYNALALALLPPLSFVITGRYYLWRSRSFWLPAAIVVIVAGPWYITMRHLVLYAADSGSFWLPVGPSLVANATGMMFVAGPVVFILAVIGTVLMCLNVRRPLPIVTSEYRPLHVVAVAMVLAVFLFHGAIYSIYEPRYLLPAVPALILLSWPSVGYMRSVLGNRPRLAAAAFLSIVVAHAACKFAVPAKKTDAYVKAAEAVLACGLPHSGAVLVSADATGEGMLTAEFVMHDRRPDHYVVRASKVLATQTLMGDRYQLLYRTPEEVMKALDSIPIAIVVIQQCPERKCGEHENVLTQAIVRYPERWWLSSVIPSDTGSPILIYRIIGNEVKTVRTLDVDMSYTLGGTIVKQ